MKPTNAKAGNHHSAGLLDLKTVGASLSKAAVNVRFTRAWTLLRDVGIGVHRVVDGDRRSRFYTQADGIERAFDTLLELEAFVAGAVAARGTP